MTIIPSNMIGHFLVHSTISPSRSSPSALHWLQKLKRPLAVQLRSSCEKLGELFLCRQLIPAMMKIKGGAKNIDNDVDTDWSWCCGCFQKWENTIHQHHSQHTLTVILFIGPESGHWQCLSAVTHSLTITGQYCGRLLKFSTRSF